MRRRGEKSRLGSRWVAVYPKILALCLARAAQGLIPPTWGVLCPVHSCRPVLGLRISAWETGTPRHSVQGIPRGCLGWYERHMANVYRQGCDDGSQERLQSTLCSEWCGNHGEGRIVGDHESLVSGKPSVHRGSVLQGEVARVRQGDEGLPLQLRHVRAEARICREWS